MLRKSFLFNCALLVSAMQAVGMEETSHPVVAIATGDKPSGDVPIANSLPNAPAIPALPSKPFEPFTGVINGSKVRMRTHPSLESHVIRETLQGEMFAVLGEINDYYAVAAPKETKGYVFRTFILDKMIEGERVNVRLYPDLESPVIAQLNRGDRVNLTATDDAQSKWLTIELPECSRFYIAKEYVEKKGGIDLIAKIEKKREEGLHQVKAAALFAQSEIAKPFEQIDFDKVHEKFKWISKNYQDIPSIADQCHETLLVLQDIYIQKKLAFLEGNSENKKMSHEIDSSYITRLAKLGIELKNGWDTKPVLETASHTTQVIGLSSPIQDAIVTEKMLAWQPLEESMYHLWAASNREKTIEDFYAEEKENATVLTGTVEPFTRPVKNRPGDFILKKDNLPIAFLYSTQVNLENLVGKSVTVIGTPRQNHHFAFPAYFVLNVE